MSFRPKPWYFERDCPFCTRSASSFCRNPLNFLAHPMWLKWRYHAKFQPFQSSSAVLFKFRVILAQNKSWNAWKIANEVRKGWNMNMWLRMVHMNDKKVWSQNKFKNMKCLCNRWVFIRNPRTSKDMVQLVHEVHPVFAVTLSSY